MGQAPAQGRTELSALQERCFTTKLQEQCSEAEGSWRLAKSQAISLQGVRLLGRSGSCCSCSHEPIVSQPLLPRVAGVGKWLQALGPKLVWWLSGRGNWRWSDPAADSAASRTRNAVESREKPFLAVCSTFWRKTAFQAVFDWHHLAPSFRYGATYIPFVHRANWHHLEHGASKRTPSCQTLCGLL